MCYIYKNWLRICKGANNGIDHTNNVYIHNINIDIEGEHKEIRAYLKPK